MTDETEHKRPTWDEYFMNLAKEVAKRATCDRGRSGCVIVKNKQILTTGYVGSAKGMAHCDEVGHLMKSVTHSDGTVSQHCMRTIHAEQNAIVQAAKCGIPLEGAAIYGKMEPCRACAMMIINAGIVRVVAEKRYHGAQETRDMFKAADVKLDVIDDELEKYEKQ